MKALSDLDPLLEHRVRLAVCVLLAKQEELSFSRFKEQLKVTDGNLGAQLRKLEEAGYIGLRRDFVGRKPVTWYRLTDSGRVALDGHLSALRTLIDSAD
ncbi:winged helix-turn-helix domain-containing protein [Microbulbifer litoralis]|uniref:winged helix-turn-helix domain-containing protein n=1 Tax=Microbulbifer litoralis TaxID=2933965 RepID=UPI00202974FA|nr:transcriptional regulator [Microbulbifer sp. GX H0434]